MIENPYVGQRVRYNYDHGFERIAGKIGTLTEVHGTSVRVLMDDELARPNHSGGEHTTWGSGTRELISAFDYDEQSIANEYSID